MTMILSLLRHFWHSAQALRLVASWVMLLALTLLVIAGSRWVMNRPFFTIQKIEVVAIESIPFAQIDSTVLRAVKLAEIKEGFFRADLSKVKRQFEALPWVRSASVRRQWPNRIQVTIEEHRAVAHWDDGRLVNTYGELFTANSAALDNENELPTLNGPVGTHPEVIKRWRELDDWLKPLSVKVSALNLSDRFAWELNLNNGAELLLGRDPVAPTIASVSTGGLSEDGANVRTMPEVRERIGRWPTHIDLRHVDGFAIRYPARAESGQQTESKPDDKSPIQNKPNKPSTGKAA
jgi:cell division protein FtsQ